MRVVETIAAARAAVEAASRAAGRPLGLVPTMGFLHEGHLSLVRAARRECATVAVSIFVNPTQFGPREDFAAYPRDPERDLAFLREARADLVFAPPVAEVYPPGFDTFVTVGGVTERLEGAARPGHFRGVATVVAKLFQVLQPDRAYFGQKDAQQVVVIRKLVADLAIPVVVVALPTVREPDGLALSSRNVYLSPEERRAAPALWRALRAAEARWQAGERDAERLREAMRSVLAAEPLVRVDYVSVADAATLVELARLEGPALASLAAYVGRTRLIDNVLLPSPPERGRSGPG
jgi:pantoate--beta-alanine ligase